MNGRRAPPTTSNMLEEAGLEKDPETGQCVPIKDEPATDDDDQTEEPQQEEQSSDNGGDEQADEEEQ